MSIRKRLQAIRDKLKSKKKLDKEKAEKVSGESLEKGFGKVSEKADFIKNTKRRFEEDVEITEFADGGADKEEGFGDEDSFGKEAAGKKVLPEDKEEGAEVEAEIESEFEGESSDGKIGTIQEFSKQQISDEVVPEDRTPSKSEVISAKKVVYIEIDDEVTSVYDKIKNLRIKHVYLVVPQRAVIFQSIVNLKILKKKSEEIGQNLYMITNDKNGIYLAQQLEIPVYDRASTSERPMILSSEEEDEKLWITPIKASVNSVIEEAPTRLAEKKLSISELLSFARSKKKLFGVGKVEARDLSPVRVSKSDFEPRGGEEKIKKHKFVLVAPNKQALIGLAVFSILVLLVIFYIALPGATLYLTPSASVLEKSVNIVLADYDTNRAELDAATPHMIASYKVSLRVERSATHVATGKKLSPNAANASGKLTIINNSSNDWPLIEKTRFQTNDGLVYRITNPVTVPAATSGGPGKTEVYVVADSVDAFGQIMGERGNIGPAKFFLPGLKESNRSLLTAESTGNMAGGITSFSSQVTKEDIDAAKSKLNDVLFKAVEDELKNEIQNQNELNDTDYILLTGENAIELGKPIYNPLSVIEGQEVPQFEVSGYTTATGYAYSKSEMTKILTQELLLKKSPQKKLVTVNESSISYNIFEKDPIKNRIKVTANIKGIEEFDLDPKKENGARLITKIKEHIVGKSIEDAKNYIQNLPEINKVDIESWPAWSPTIPTVPDNIDVEIRDAIVVE